MDDGLFAIVAGGITIGFFGLVGLVHLWQSYVRKPSPEGKQIIDALKDEDNNWGISAGHAYLYDHASINNVTKITLDVQSNGSVEVKTAKSSGVMVVPFSRGGARIARFMRAERHRRCKARDKATKVKAIKDLNYVLAPKCRCGEESAIPPVTCQTCRSSYCGDCDHGS